jgi:hypothetical protein
VYSPSNWPAWFNDGLAHVNLFCALFLVAWALRAQRHLPDLYPVERHRMQTAINWCCAGAALNLVVVLIHFRLWIAQMGG